MGLKLFCKLVKLVGLEIGITCAGHYEKVIENIPGVFHRKIIMIKSSREIHWNIFIAVI